MIGAAVMWWVFGSSAQNCQAASSPSPGVIQAAKVTVRPWLGEHHVYGIFVIPEKYGDGERYYATMKMPVGSFVVEAGGERESNEDLLIPPGYYSKRVYVSTRLVLWRVITGQLGRIGDPCNWTIEFVERQS